MASITFQKRRQRFNGTRVIEKPELEIHDHELMVFVGPRAAATEQRVTAA